MADFTLDVPISFGHCDPAGIVFYPNYFRWFDRCFHAFLQERAGGHRALCARLDAKGVGLMDVDARFPSPATEGDLMRLQMTLAEWGSKTLRLEYAGLVGGRAVVEGHELRGLFVLRDGRMRAGDMAPLRAILEGS
ncbi:MAG: acyl-CoA thioesterase [Pseudooceanicola sp.]|nr:acyl-CoA thioesterase [Pseudooceanicola sp.]